MRTRRGTNRWVAAAALASGALGVAGNAAADQVHGTRSEELVERRHVIDVEMDHGYAKLTVKRSVFNGGDRHDQAVFYLDVPEGAVAVGLRTLGSLNGKPHWFDGELMEAEAAAAKYRELTGIGGYYPKDPALLSWRHQGLLALQVFPCPPGQEKMIEYTYLLPTSYRDGAHRVELPGLGTEKLLASVTARVVQSGDRLAVDGKILGPRAPVVLKRDASVELALLPGGHAENLGGELAQLPVGKDRVLNHWRFRAAPRLSELPERAQVVIAIDSSRSLDAGAIRAAQATARAYLSHLPDAQVQLLTFDRQTQARFGGFVSALSASFGLGQLRVQQGNGSNVDDALVEADRLLAQRPAGLPRRVLLFTDSLSRSGLRPARLSGSLAKSGALLHVISMEEGDAELSRDDAHAWSTWVSQTGGVTWNASARLSASQDAAAVRSFEELARPLRLHHLRVSSKLWQPEDGYFGDSVEEGQGLEYDSIDDQALGSVQLEGMLWAQPLTASWTPDSAVAKRQAALVFGGELLHSLSEPEMMPLAMLGGAVSPVTSYLAIEPGVRPSTEGLDWGGGEGFGVGAGGLGLAGVGQGYGGGVGWDPQAWLVSQLSKAWSACGGQPQTASVELESTLDEVVDVLRVAVPGDDPVNRRCLERAAWDLQLASQFRGTARRTWQIAI